MEPDDLNDRLSRIETHLTLWMKAHQGQGESAMQARRQLVLHYHGACYRYLLGMLRDPAAAEELSQDFAVRLLRGDFKHFDPERGLFRNFVKTALRRLVIDYWRQQKQRQQRELPPLRPEQEEPETPPEPHFEKDFLKNWKEELLAKTWVALRNNQKETGQPYHTVLTCKVNQPELRAAELAQQVSAQLGRSVSAEAMRQLLHRARRRFAELLWDEVARSLATDQPDLVVEELIELGLMCYCRSAVSGAAVSITWHQPFPLKAQGTNSLGVTVKCHLTGTTSNGQKVDITKNATPEGRTTWLIDFGAVAKGNYELTALGNDGSSYGPIAIAMTENSN